MAIAKPNFNPSPKKRFAANPTWVTQHKDLLTMPQLERGFDHAALQMQRELTREIATDAAANFHMMAGVSKFMHIFKTLAEEDRAEERRVEDNLPSNLR